MCVYGPHTMSTMCLKLSRDQSVDCQYFLELQYVGPKHTVCGPNMTANVLSETVWPSSYPIHIGTEKYDTFNIAHCL